MTGSKASESKVFHPLGLYDYRAIIASEEACLRFLRRARWPNGIRCPRCQGRRIRRLRERGKIEYRCRRCDHHFSDISGTIFVKTRTPLAKWFLAIGLFKIGISANALMGELGVSYKVAWAMLDKLRRATMQGLSLEPLSGQVDVDGVYSGSQRRDSRGHAGASKRPVLDIKARGARMRHLAAVSSDGDQAASDFIWAMLERLINYPLSGDKSREPSLSGPANDDERS